ncbi:hypothetical protein D9M70_519320 [compost metagenome]
MDDLALPERLLAVIASLRLDTDDDRARRTLLGAECRAGEQAPAAERRDDQVEFAHLLDQFQHRRALPGDHIRMVEGRDEDGIALGRQLRADRRPVLGIAVIEHDIGAIAAGRRHLHFGRILRHHDRRGNTLQPCGIGDRLRMVAGGEGDDAPLLAAFLQGGDRIVGTAEFEGAGALEIFRLEEKPRAGGGIGCAGGQHRRSMRHAGDAVPCRQHVVESWKAQCRLCR